MLLILFKLGYNKFEPMFWVPKIKWDMQIDKFYEFNCLMAFVYQHLRLVDAWINPMLFKSWTSVQMSHVNNYVLANLPRCSTLPKTGILQSGDLSIIFMCPHWQIYMTKQGGQTGSSRLSRCLGCAISAWQTPPRQISSYFFLTDHLPTYPVPAALPSNVLP